MHRIAIFSSRVFWLLVGISLCLLAPAAAFGQFIGSVEVRPFVTAVIPVVGPGGAVGGVSIDAHGALSRSSLDAQGRLREARIRAAAPISAELRAASPLRKISLRGLTREIDRRRRAGVPVSDELQNLAGLTQLQYVFVYPEQADIVIAGQAEAWEIDAGGNVVGRTSRRPVLQLDDLIVSLRTTTSGQPIIACSIDPTEEGVKRLKPVLHSRSLSASEETVAQLEETLGPQRITIAGVPPRSHFARVLVAADFRMKRLGMGLEVSPVDDLPSYMELLSSRTAAPPRGLMPRWWMAPRYEPLLRDEEGLAWEIRGGVQVLSEESRLERAGSDKTSAKRNTVSQQWADTMSRKFESLAKELPVFGELRHCMDLAIIAALLTKENLLEKSGCDISLLLNESQVAVAEYGVPHTVATTASLVRKGSGWIVSLSGGVEIDCPSVVNRTETRASLSSYRERSKGAEPTRWWWD